VVLPPPRELSWWSSPSSAPGHKSCDRSATTTPIADGRRSLVCRARVRPSQPEAMVELKRVQNRDPLFLARLPGPGLAADQVADARRRRRLMARLFLAALPSAFRWRTSISITAQLTARSAVPECLRPRRSVENVRSRGMVRKSMLGYVTCHPAHECAGSDGSPTGAGRRASANAAAALGGGGGGGGGGGWGGGRLQRARQPRLQDSDISSDGTTIRPRSSTARLSAHELLAGSRVPGH
jgi:hypothetical protein